MMRTTAVTLSVLLALGCGVAHADPAPSPAPVQCKATGGSFGQNACRYPDGSVMICGLTGCHAIFVQMAPGFWDQP